MSEATAAVYLSADDGKGEAFLLADPAELQTDTLMISRPDDPGSLFMVDRAAFMAAGYSVTVDRPPTTTTGKRRRFGLRGRGR